MFSRQHFTCIYTLHTYFSCHLYYQTFEHNFIANHWFFGNKNYALLSFYKNILKFMVTKWKLFFWWPDGKFQLWSHAIKFRKTDSPFSIFGHFFCPFLKFPKNFPQIFSIVSTKVPEIYIYKFNLKNCILHNSNIYFGTLDYWNFYRTHEIYK